MKFKQWLLPVIISLISLSLLILITSYTTVVHADISANIEQAYHDGILSGKSTQRLQDGMVVSSYLIA